MHRVPVELCVDRVAAAAEVDEVEQRQVLLEELLRDREALDELVCRDDRLALVPAGREQVREQRLQHAEALRRHRAGRALERLGLLARRRGSRRLGRLALVRLDDLVEPLVDELDELRRIERPGPPFLAEHPAREVTELGVARGEDPVLDAPALDHALHPPGGVRVQLDLRLADDLSELPLVLAAVLRGLEVLRHAEVALPPRGEADVAADARHAERAHGAAVVVVADHVPRAALRQEGVGVDRPLRLLVPADGVVGELDGALLRDRVLELREAPRHLGRVVRVAHLDAHGGLGRLLVEAGAAERKVLQSKA